MKVKKEYSLGDLANEAAIVEDKISSYIATLEPHQRTQGVLMGALMTIICDVWEVGKKLEFGDKEFILMAKEFLKTSRERNKGKPKEGWKMENIA